MAEKPDPHVGSPFPGLSFAGELDDMNETPLEVTMSERYEGYMNFRTLELFEPLVSGKLLFLRFLPDVEQGEVIMVPGSSANEYGATPVNYTPTLNGAEINLRLAVKRMRFPVMKGRTYTFPVSTRRAPDGKVYPVLKIKEAESRPTRKVRQNGSASAEAAPGQQS